MPIELKTITKREFKDQKELDEFLHILPTAGGIWNEATVASLKNYGWTIIKSPGVTTEAYIIRS